MGIWQFVYLFICLSFIFIVSIYVYCSSNPPNLYQIFIYQEKKYGFFGEDRAIGRWFLSFTGVNLSLKRKCRWPGGHFTLLQDEGILPKMATVDNQNRKEIVSCNLPLLFIFFYPSLNGTGLCVREICRSSEGSILKYLCGKEMFVLERKVLNVGLYPIPLFWFRMQV